MVPIEVLADLRCRQVWPGTVNSFDGIEPCGNRCSIPSRSNDDLVGKAVESRHSFNQGSNWRANIPNLDGAVEERSLRGEGCLFLHLIQQG